MSEPNYPGTWNRRNFLAAAAAAATLASRSLRALPPAPFSTFTDIAQQAGLRAPTIYGEADTWKFIYESVGGGCAFIDFDNDGWMDLFILGGTLLAGAPSGATNRLYRNNRDGTFTDVTDHAGLHEAGWASGVCIGDYNNDGFDDIFCTFYGRNKLYRNNGNGTFTDVTKEAGLLDAEIRFGSGCSFLDYNRDGHLDLFVANYVNFDTEHPPLPSVEKTTCSFEGMAVSCGPRGMKPGRHSLYRNNGDGTFTDVSVPSGIAKFTGSYGLTAVTADLDGDGWPDIFVACDSTPSLLFMNNHDGTFREEGLNRGVAVSGEGKEQAGMGIGLGDLDFSGNTSLLVTHFQREATGVYRNTGKANFDDVTAHSHLDTESRYVSWGIAVSDFDNDGLLDVLWATGNVYPEVEHRYPQYPFKGPRVLFRNLGNAVFERLGAEAGPALAQRHSSRGLAVGDFDNDGDLDMVIMNINEPPSLLRNDAPDGNHWLKVKLVGTQSNRSAIGSRVLVHFNGKVQLQDLLSQQSYLSCNDPRLHFGLGKAKAADIDIYWPNGAHERYANVGIDRLLTFKEGAGLIANRGWKP